MRTKKMLSYAFSSFLLLISVMVVHASIGFAQENAVTTKGEVVLFAEDSSSSSEPPVSSSEEPPVDSSSVPSDSSQSDSSSSITKPAGSNKPGGSYPSTGELVKSSLTITGLLLLLIVLAVYLWQKKKQNERTREGS